MIEQWVRTEGRIVDMSKHKLAFSSAEAEDNFINDNGDWNISSVDPVTGLQRYDDRTGIEVGPAPSTKISTQAQASRGAATTHGLKALTGTTAKQKSFGEHLRREVIEIMPAELVIGLRGLTRAKDFADRSGEIRARDFRFFFEYAAQHAEAERALAAAEAAERAEAAGARATERQKTKTPVFKRIAAVSEARGLAFDVKQVFFGSAEKWAPLNDLDDQAFGDFVEAKIALSQINTSDAAWRPARDAIEARFGFYI
jgi:hypothetical protein